MRRGPPLLLLAAVSAILFAAALPNELTPWGNPLLGAVCIAPFLAAAVMTVRPKRAAAIGAFYGALQTLLSSFWLMFFQEFTVWTLGGVVLAYAGFGALLGSVLRGVAQATPRAYRPFALAAVWTVYEYLKSNGFLGYPWGLVAHPVHTVLPLIQISDITGVWGVSLLVSMVNALVAEGILRARERGPVTVVRGVAARQAGVAAFLWLAALGYGVYRLAEPAAPAAATRTLNVILVQPDGDPWRPFNNRGIMTNQVLTEQGAREGRPLGWRPDLVVWSETSLAVDPALNPDYYSRSPPDRPLNGYLREMDVPHLVGSPIVLSMEERLAMNGAILMDPTGAVVETYGKRHPVPFAEAIPFWEYAAVRSFFSDVVGIQYPWTMGTRPVVFEMTTRGGESIRFGVPICFEDAFGDLNRVFVLRGADLLVNLSNDSWSRTVSALTQHFVVARYRTVETRRALIRSTNGGITAVVDTKGTVTALLPWFQPGYLNASLDLPDNPRITTYVRYGDWLPLCLAGLLVVFLGVTAFRGRG